MIIKFYINQDLLQHITKQSFNNKRMAKKFKISKLMHNKNSAPTNPTSVKSAFNNHSQRIQKAKEKKIEKLNDTKNRLMNKRKENKAIKITSRLAKGNKANKFALLDEPNERYQPSNHLTHKGTSLDKVKHFNDMHFDNQESGNLSDHFDEMHNEVNFHGFDEDNQNVQGQQGDRRKSKNQVYKEIIEKSKMHKRDRQEQYEQNFNAAVQLDQQFPELVSKLKFRNNDAKVREKIENRDLEYERLMNQLKDDERVVANRVVDNNKKGVQKIKKKKAQQLNQIMRNSDDDEEEDIRGWVKGFESGSEEEQEDEESQDEIDDVELSSGDQDQDIDQSEGQGSEEEEEEEDEQEDGEDYEDGSAESLNQEQKAFLRKNDKKIIIKSASEDSSQCEESQSVSEQIVKTKMPKEPKNIIKNKQITKNNQFSGKNNLTANTKNNRKNFQKK